MTTRAGFHWINSKTGPRIVETTGENRHNTGWVKDPGFKTVLRKEYQELIFKHWQDLTDDQRTGMYNHLVKYTTDTYGRSQTADTNYIFFESRGTMEIQYMDEFARFTLSIVSSDGTRCHLAENPDNMGNAAAIRWLKHFAQYLIDEPDEFRVLICQQTPIAPYVNIPTGIPEVPA